VASHPVRPIFLGSFSASAPIAFIMFFAFIAFSQSMFANGAAEGA
jgi:hypothetical protein